MTNNIRQRRSVADACWSMLRELRAALRLRESSYCSVCLGDENRLVFDELLELRGDAVVFDLVFKPEVYAKSAPSGRPRFVPRDLVRVQELDAFGLPEDVRRLTALYAPYAAAAGYARARGRTLAVSHFAQTLDGRIATVNGDSRWIGNEDNLLHAHRMRALCDAVLVGTGTVRRDSPRLTVRRVPGDNPVRVVLGECEIRELHCLTESCEDPVLVLRCANGSGEDTGSVRFIPFTKHENMVPGLDIMRCLYEQGLYSVYVEGGARTTSALLRDNVIDIVQLHISPMIMGSGKDAFELEEVSAVDASLKFQSHAYVPVDDGIMFMGVPVGVSAPEA